MTNTVNKAIIMAAGKGNRMHPVTMKTPKPLVTVNGIPMIDTVIDALHKNGIEEIYVVVGYLKEQFYKWAANRTDIKLIDNPDYNTANNISSLYYAREHLGNSMILDGDQIILKPEILDPHFMLSGYNAVWTDNETSEWLLQVENDQIKSCSRTGGNSGWQLFSISRWTMRDGQKLKQRVEHEYESGNRDIYWDDVAMFYHFSDFKLGIYPMEKGSIVEVDSLKELIDLDDSYAVFDLEDNDQ